MRLADVKDEQALDILAEIIEPATAICQNQKLVEAVRKNENRVKIATIAIKENKKEVMQILAALNGVPFEEYHCNPISVSKHLAEIISLFFSQAQMAEQTSSTSASENIEV